MRRPFKILAWGTAIALLIGAGLVAGALAIGGSLDHTRIVINGEPLGAADLGAASWLLALAGAAIGLLVAFIVVLVVVPLAVLLPLLITALLLAGALVLVSGIAAVVFSPLILLIALGWLVWRLVRGPRRAVDRAPDRAPVLVAGDGATIAR
jgi:Na+-transporting methylmalonyl-CoA/oxaloacetate decarboxylase gamma subunit